MSSTWSPRTCGEAPPPPPPPPPPPAACVALPWPCLPQPAESLAARRERIATAVLAGLAANNARIDFSIDDDVDVAIRSADKLIEQLDKEATR